MLHKVMYPNIYLTIAYVVVQTHYKIYMAGDRIIDVAAMLRCYNITLMGYLTLRNLQIILIFLMSARGLR